MTFKSCFFIGQEKLVMPWGATRGLRGWWRLGSLSSGTDIPDPHAAMDVPGDQRLSIGCEASSVQPVPRVREAAQFAARANVPAPQDVVGIPGGHRLPIRGKPENRKDRSV